MTSKPVALLLADLGVTKAHSRPHVSDDNSFSESHFKTLKYRPDFPDHSGLGLLTPEVVHTRRAEELGSQRQQTLNAAFAAHPERFVRKPPQPPTLPIEVWINRPPKPESAPPDPDNKTQ